MLLFLFIFVSLSKQLDTKPIVLIHGIISSILEGKINIEDSIDLPWFCSNQLKNQHLWISINDFIPFYNQCFIKYLTPIYDPINNIQRDAFGINITVPRFGSVYSLNILNPTWPFSKFTQAFNGLIKELQAIGYQDEQNMFGAPYDWRYFRYDEYEHKQNWYENLKYLIIKAYELNNKQKVVLISHSMGGLMIYKFLDYVGKTFVNNYIEKWIPISTPFLGAVKEVASAIPGNDFGLPISPSLIKLLFRTSETISFIFPTGGKERFGDIPILKFKNGEKEYTIDDMVELINSVSPSFSKQHGHIYEHGINELYKKYNYTIPFSVDTHCFISSGFETMQTIIMRTKHLEGDYDIDYGNGDGTVNIQSLEFCKRMNVTSFKDIGKYGHGDILNSKVLIQHLIPLILNNYGNCEKNGECGLD